MEVYFVETLEGVLMHQRIEDKALYKTIGGNCKNAIDKFYAAVGTQEQPWQFLQFY